MDMDATWGRSDVDSKWSAAVDLANRLAAGGDLPNLLSPVLLDGGEVLHADVTTEGWRFHGADVTYAAPHAVVIGGPLMFGSSPLGAPLSRRRARREAETLAAPQWRSLGELRILATDRRLLVWYEGAWASVWYDAIREFCPDLAAGAARPDFDDDPPYCLAGPWVPYLTVIVTTLLAATVIAAVDAVAGAGQRLSHTDRCATSVAIAELDSVLDPGRPVVGAAHGVVEVAGAEVEDDRRTLPRFEECGEPVGAGSAGVVGVEGEDEWVWELGESDGDGFVAVGGAEHGDGSVAGGGRGQRVDRAFGDDHLGVACLDGADPGERAGWGRGRRSGSGSGVDRVGVGDAELGVDGVTVPRSREDDAGARGMPSGRSWQRGPRSAPMRFSTRTSRGMPRMSVSQRRMAAAFGLPEPLGALVDVAVEAFGVAASGRRERSVARAERGEGRQSSGCSRWPTRSARYVMASRTVPPWHARTRSMAVPPSPQPWQRQRCSPRWLREDADAAGCVRSGRAGGWGRATSGERPLAGRAPEEVVGECPEVDGGEECVAVVHGSRAPRAVAAGSAVHAGVGVDDRPSSLGPRTWWTTAVRPPTFHSARPRVSWPTMLASGAVRPKWATAASSWSGAWRRMILVAESASNPAAILHVAVPSSAWATRSEARWVMQRFATPYVRPSLKQVWR